ncbi:MAG: hypothetical protein SWK90_14200 [Chloroflexota bacterium]|nr:hypothetical protein [Chloroflexota bacterium]
MGGELGLYAVVYGGLFVVGFLYNVLVGWLERRGYDEGYTAVLVVVGVLVTLAGSAVLDWTAAGKVLGGFVASGFWMIVGSWWRHVRARREGQEAQRGEVL